MATLYSILALDDESRRWLLDEGHYVPSDGRFPSPIPLKLSLDKMENVSVDYNIGLTDFEATITDDNRNEWTTVRLASPTENSPQGYFFKGGNVQLMLRLLKHVAAKHGPMVLVPDTDCEPVVVHRDSDLGDLCANWRHLTDSET